MPETRRAPRTGAGRRPWTCSTSSPGPRDDRDLDQADELDPEEIKLRASLADALHEAGALQLAEIETEKILVLDPDHIPARMMRVEQAIEAGQFDEARPELDTSWTILG